MTLWAKDDAHDELLPAQIEAAIGPIFDMDHRLIQDHTYFVAEHEELLVGCGGWSRRTALFGRDLHRADEDVLLDPRCDSARIRAFLVHPAWARQGIGVASRRRVNRPFAPRLSEGRARGYAGGGAALCRPWLCPCRTI